MAITVDAGDITADGAVVAPASSLPLHTVQDYIDRARELLQDTASVKRYTDNELKSAMGLGLLEARRLRPDLFYGRSVLGVRSDTAGVSVLFYDEQYRLGLVYWVVGYMMLREDESGETAKAAQYITTFKQQLVSMG